MPLHILDFYGKLFTASNGDPCPILNFVNRKVSDQHNQSLQASYSVAEFQTTLFSMHSGKSPRPDGLNSSFFQKYWDIVGEEVTKECLLCLNGFALMLGSNRTNIILISKKTIPEIISDLRPISLSNVLNRIVCKVLTNHLKLVLPHIISDTQSAFIPQRLITDNIIVAYELFHSLKRQTWGHNGFLTLKTDMIKAYDRIEWPYLKLILLKLGCASEWVERIMIVVSSIQYYFIRGQEKHGPLIPQRCLRQGDPLSPYLFIICVEGLFAILSNF